MKKLIVTTLILSLALFVFTPSSFAGNGNGALVCPREQPGAEILGLVFDFQDPYPDPDNTECNGLPMDLPDEYGAWEKVCITCVAVKAQGGELIIVTSSGRYNLDAKLEGDDGNIFATDDLDVDCNPEEADPADWTRVWTFEFDSATLNAHFIINDYDINYIMDGGCETARTFEVPYGTPLDLFFKVKEATLIDDDEVPIGPPFDLMLKLKDSEFVQIYKLK